MERTRVIVSITLSTAILWLWIRCRQRSLSLCWPVALHAKLRGDGCNRDVERSINSSGNSGHGDDDNRINDGSSVGGNGDPEPTAAEQVAASFTVGADGGELGALLLRELPHAFPSRKFVKKVLKRGQIHVGGVCCTEEYGKTPLVRLPMALMPWASSAIFPP